jgi:MFS family permease
VRSYIRGIREYRRDVRLFLLYNLASNIGIGVFTLLFNLYLVQLGFREDYIGQFNSISTLAMAGISFGVGALINRFGVWRTVTAGLGWFLLSSILACIVTDATLLLVVAALSGAGTAFLFVPTMPFIVELTGRQERHGIAALAFSLNSLSMMFGSLVGGWLPRILGATAGLDYPSVETYRYTLIIGLSLAGLAVLPLLAMSAERKRSRPGDGGGPETGVIEVEHEPRTVRRNMAVFIAIGGLMSIGAGAVFPFYNVFLETQGASSGQIGLIFSAAGLMAAIFGLASPWVARRIGSLRAVVLVRLSPVPFYLLLMLSPNLPIAIWAHMIRNTSINMAWPIDSTYISEILPAKARSQVFSFRSGAWNLGWSLSSLIAGRLIVQYGYNVSFLTYIVFMSLAMTLFYVYFSRAARSQPAASRVESGEPATV